MNGLVFDIQRFSLHDGPGIRTTVFLQGCPLNCFWCHNPEGKAFTKQLQYLEQYCIGCMECFRVCPVGNADTVVTQRCTEQNVAEGTNEKLQDPFKTGALLPEEQRAGGFGAVRSILQNALSVNLDAIQSRKSPHQELNGRHVIDRSLCQLCGRCVENCCSHALSFSSSEMEDAEVVARVAEDKPFYERSGGGVTLSGGDPVAQIDFAHSILSQCKALGIHTTIDTALCCEWERIERLMPVCDLWLVDLKSMSAEAHEHTTGVSNKLILSNLRQLSSRNVPIVIRTPIIPGLSDSTEAIQAIAKEIQSLANIERWELLPFHRLGEGKFHALGIPCPTEGLPLIPKETMKRLYEAARESGIPVNGATA